MLDSSRFITYQHILFLFLLAVAPTWDYFDTRRLKRNPTSERKIRYYQVLTLWLWLATIAAYCLVGFRPLFTFSPLPGEIPWLLEHAWVRPLIGAVIVLFAAVLLLPLAIVFWKKVTKEPRTYSSADALASLSYFLPVTRTERRWYVFVCVTAGICEETLFRGFLLHYLHVFPWSLNLTPVLLIAAIIFGLQHLYQGAAGAASTVVVGFLFGLLFLMTRSLLFPMLLHAVMDLRMLAILRPPTP